MVSGMLVLAHRGANRLAPENTLPAMHGPSTGAPTASSSTSTAPPTARWWSATTPSTPVGPLGELTAAELRRALPEVPTLADVLDVCRGRLVNVEIKDADPRAAEAVVDLIAARVGHGRRPMTCWCRRSTSRPSTGCARSPPTSRPGSSRSGSIRTPP